MSKTGVLYSHKPWLQGMSKTGVLYSIKPWLQGMSKTGVLYSHKPWLQGMPKTGVLYQPQTVANRVCQKQAYFIVESWRVETLGFGYKFYSTTIFS
jgi:hypothetical protein